MPTLDVRFEASLEDSDLSARLDVQAGRLGALSDAVAALTSGRPPGLDDLERALAGLGLPDIRVPSDFSARIAALRAAVPTDLSAILDALLAQIAVLRAELEGFVEPLAATLSALDAVAQLAGINLRCDTDGEAGRGVAAEVPAGAEAGAAAPADLPAGPAANSPVASAATEVHAVLERVPSPVDVPAVLELLARAVADPQVDDILRRPIPYLHDFRDTLTTLVRWRDLPRAAIALEIAGTVDAAASFVGASVRAKADALAADVAALASQLEIEALGDVTDAVTAGVAAISAAVAADATALGAATAEAGAALASYDAVRTRFVSAQLEAQIRSVVARLREFPDDLEEGMNHCLSVLLPGGALGDLSFFQVPTAGERAVGADPFVALERKLSTAVNWLGDVLQKVDVARFAQHVEQLEQTVDEAAAALDRSILDGTVKVQQLFGSLEEQLEAIDTDALVRDVEAATRAFVDDLTGRLADLVGRVRDTVASALEAIGVQADAFDPREAIEALRAAFAALAGVFEDPEVRGAADQVRAAIEGTEAQLGSISFTPVADEVIRGIDAIAAELDKIDESKLNPALRAALGAAVSVLPDSIEPVTAGLTVELSGFVESGPVPGLHSLQDQIRTSLEGALRFEPASLVGDTLARPYRALVDDLAAVSPAALLDPARERLDAFRERLRTQANPGRAVEPLERPFEAVLSQVDRLRPDALAEPLEAELRRVADTALAPALAALDAVLEPVEVVADKGRSMADTLDHIVAMLRAISGILGGLVGAEDQTRAWVERILQPLEGVPHPAVSSALGRLDAAFGGASSEELVRVVGEAVDPLMARLGAVDPGARHARLVQERRAVTAASFDALADSPEKTAAIELLARIDPLGDFATPVRSLAALRDELTQAPVALESWDAFYVGEHGAASCLRVSGSVDVRGWVAAEVERVFTLPVIAVFVRAEAMQRILAPLVANVEAVASAIGGALDGLLAAPEAVLRVKARLDGAAERVRGLGGAVMREALGEVFASLRAKLEAVSPTRLRALVDEEFGRVLDSLSLESALPDLAALDEAHAEVLAKARALDPEQLVIQVVQPEFEATLRPLISAFDLTAAIDLLVERLSGLDEELNGELARVDEAYRRLLRSIPGGGASVSASVSVDL